VEQKQDGSVDTEEITAPGPQAIGPEARSTPDQHAGPRLLTDPQGRRAPLVDLGRC
jgi:hypothetical protein